MPKELSPGKPNTRRYTPEEKAQAVPPDASVTLRSVDVYEVVRDV